MNRTFERGVAIAPFLSGWSTVPRHWAHDCQRINAGPLTPRPMALRLRCPRRSSGAQDAFPIPTQCHHVPQCTLCPSLSPSQWALRCHGLGGPPSPLPKRTLPPLPCDGGSDSDSVPLLESALTLNASAQRDPRGPAFCAMPRPPVDRFCPGLSTAVAVLWRLLERVAKNRLTTVAIRFAVSRPRVESPPLQRTTPVSEHREGLLSQFWEQWNLELGGCIFWRSTEISLLRSVGAGRRCFGGC